MATLQWYNGIYMARKELEYVDDEQPTDGHVLPEHAQDPDEKALTLQGRYTGKLRLQTDGTVTQAKKQFEVQSPRRVDILAGGMDGQTLFETTSDALPVAEQTGFDPRDYPDQPLPGADNIDIASVFGQQVNTVKRHGASRHHWEEGNEGRIKNFPPK